MKWLMIALLAVSGPVLAQGKSGGSDAKAAVRSPVEIKLWSVHATNTHQNMDVRLKRIAKHLGNLKFSGFDLLGRQSVDLKVKAKKKFAIVGKRAVHVTVLSRDEKRARVKVQIVGAKGTLLDTTVSIRRNGFFIVAGPKHRDGVLVLPIFARY